MTSLGTAPGCRSTRFGDNLQDRTLVVDKPGLVRFLSPKLCTATGQRWPGHALGQTLEVVPCVAPGGATTAAVAAWACGASMPVGSGGRPGQVFAHAKTTAWGVLRAAPGHGSRCETPGIGHGGKAVATTARVEWAPTGPQSRGALVPKRPAAPRGRSSTATGRATQRQAPDPGTVFHKHRRAAREAGTFFFLECNILK